MLRNRRETPSGFGCHGNGYRAGWLLLSGLNCSLFGSHAVQASCHSKPPTSTYTRDANMILQELMHQRSAQCQCVLVYSSRKTTGGLWESAGFSLDELEKIAGGISCSAWKQHNWKKISRQQNNKSRSREASLVCAPHK